MPAAARVIDAQATLQNLGTGRHVGCGRGKMAVVNAVSDQLRESRIEYQKGPFKDRSVPRQPGTSCLWLAVGGSPAGHRLLPADDPLDGLAAVVHEHNQV